MVKVFESTDRAADEVPFAGLLTRLPFTLPEWGRDGAALPPEQRHVYTAHPPKRAVWSRLNLINKPHLHANRRVEIMIDFLRATLGIPADGSLLEERLLDPVDRIDLEDLFPVVNYLSREWAEQIDRIKQGLPAVEPEAEPEVTPAPGVEPDAQTPATPAAPVTGELPAIATGLPPVPAAPVAVPPAG